MVMIALETKELDQKLVVDCHTTIEMNPHTLYHWL
jgi:hypothetical protein